MHYSVVTLKDTCCFHMVSFTSVSFTITLFIIKSPVDVKTKSLIWYIQPCHNIIDDDNGSFFVSEDQLWEGPARRHTLRWLISPILDRQILGHLGHKKVGPVGSCSHATFQFWLMQYFCLLQAYCETESFGCLGETVDNDLKGLFHVSKEGTVICRKAGQGQLLLWADTKELMFFFLLS